MHYYQQREYQQKLVVWTKKDQNYEQHGGWGRTIEPQVWGYVPGASYSECGKNQDSFVSKEGQVLKALLKVSAANTLRLHVANVQMKQTKDNTPWTREFLHGYLILPRNIYIL